MDHAGSWMGNENYQDERSQNMEFTERQGSETNNSTHDQAINSSDRPESPHTLSLQATQSLRSSARTRHEPTEPLKRQKTTRNHILDAEWEPFRDSHELRLNEDEVTGGIWFMNPTHVQFTYLSSDGHGRDTYRQGHTDSGIQYHWTSRNNRKGRHALMIRQTSERHVEDQAVWPTTGIAPLFKSIWRMGTCFFIWDISYIIGVMYTVASAVLVTNAFISFLPYIDPGLKLPDCTYVVEGVLSLLGCTLFLVSSFLTFLEAVNVNRRGCFGWKTEQVWIKNTGENELDNGAERGPVTRIVPDWENCLHRRNGWAQPFQNNSNEQDDNGDFKQTTPQHVRQHKHVKDKEPWMWLPSWHEVRRHFIYDVGFVACTILLCSSILFCASAIAALISLKRNNDEIARFIRLPQLVAGLGFITCSTLFMIETQTNWWHPQFRVLGWHLSCWNAIGGAGFAASAAFALASSEGWAKFQLACSFFWGAWAFLIASLIQWYEALNKHPVERLTD